MKKLSIVFSLLFVNIFWGFNNSYISNSSVTNDSIVSEVNVKNILNNSDDAIAELIISKINLKQKVYNVGNAKNSINKNVTILNKNGISDLNDGLLFLAAHSGNSKVSFFKNLHKLKVDDAIDLYYNGKNYHYYVVSTQEEQQSGFIHVTRDSLSKYLVLTTCSSKKGYQLTVVALLESVV